MLANDIEQAGYKRSLNAISNRKLPLDPTTLIDNQRKRDFEAIETLELKQQAVRKAGSTAALKAINSAQNPTEIAVLTTTTEVMKIVNEIEFRKEKEKLLKELKRKKEKEIDNLYRGIINPIKKTREEYQLKCAVAWKKEDEKLAADWAMYYNEIIQKIDKNFSYNHTDWAIIEKIKADIQQPEKPFSYLSGDVPTSEEAAISAKRKLYAWTTYNPLYELAKNDSKLADDSQLRFAHSAEKLYAAQSKTLKQNENPIVASNTNKSVTQTLEVLNSKADKLNSTVAVLNSKMDELTKEKSTSTKQKPEKTKEWTVVLNEKSITLLANVIEIEKNNAEAYYYLGFLSKDINERTRLLSIAYSLNPTNEKYKEDAYWHQILKEDNEQLFKNYLSTYPNAMYAKEAKSYLEYKAIINHLDAAKTDTERRENIETYLKTRDTSPWYRSVHLKTAPIYNEIAASIEYEKLKKSVNTIFPYENQAQIKQFIEKYNTTTFKEKAEKLIPMAYAAQNFNALSVDVAMNPFSSISYTNSFKMNGQSRLVELNTDMALSLNFDVGFRVNKNITTLDSKGKLALGYLIGGQFEFNFYQPEGTQTIKDSQVNSTETSKAKVLFEYPTVDIELGIGFSRYLYGIVGYRIRPEATANRDNEIQQYPNSLSGTNGLILGATSNIPLGRMAIEATYKKYSTDVVSSKDIKLRLYFLPLENFPGQLFFQYDYLNATNESLFTTQTIRKMYSIGIRVGGFTDYTIY